jgi:hypothetical protein
VVGPVGLSPEHLDEVGLLQIPEVSISVKLTLLAGGSGASGELEIVRRAAWIRTSRR